MVRRLGLGKNNHLTYASLALNPRFGVGIAQAYLLKCEPAHDKTYSKTCATSKDSDQPAHPHSLIRVFIDLMYLLQPPGYPKKDKQDPLP